jgi:hypothetical protein
MNSLRNERGILTVDFLFSIVLILGLSGLLFVMCFTLSVASVTQYVTFATARNYAVGHLTPQLQTERANAKYNELIAHPVLKPLYNNGWFQVDAVPGVGDHTTLVAGYNEAAQGVNKFWGASTDFTAKVLAFTIPFFGSTDDENNGEGFKTKLGSYLGRDPSAEECLNLTAQRWNQIKKLGAGYSTQGGKYFPQADDGC